MAKGPDSPPCNGTCHVLVSIVVPRLPSYNVFCVRSIADPSPGGVRVSIYSQPHHSHRGTCVFPLMRGARSQPRRPLLTHSQKGGGEFSLGICMQRLGLAVVCEIQHAFLVGLSFVGRGSTVGCVCKGQFPGPQHRDEFHNPTVNHSIGTERHLESNKVCVKFNSGALYAMLLASECPPYVHEYPAESPHRILQLPLFSSSESPSI